jgi:nicotinamide-nucleotide amidase
MSADVPHLLEELARRGCTVAAAESLTGGLVTAALTDVPGASTVVRGGVVAYVDDVKRDVVGVDAAVLTAAGAVSREVAAALAEGVRVRLAATYGVATTGVAGPDQQGGRPVGEVFVAVAGPSGCVVRGLDLSGQEGRAAVRVAAVSAALALLADVAGEDVG